MDSVKELFASALPSWPSEKLDAAMKHLAENMGVEGPGCLEYMNVEEDLKAILKPIEARKVVRFLASFLQSPGNTHNISSSSNSVTMNAVPTATSPASSSGPSQPATTTPGSAHTSNRLLTPEHGWAERFEVPWSKMPEEFVTACIEGKRPAKVHLLAAVRVTAAEIKKVSTHPGKANLTTIAKAMVAKYDKALADFIQDLGMVAGGATTLVNRLVRQFENFNRYPGNSLRRKLLMLPEDDSIDETGCPEKTRKRRASSKIVKDAYGCVAWQPELPGGETDEMQLEKKEWLIEEFKKGEIARNKSQIGQFMTDTYPSQRFVINQKVALMSQISLEWPFLVSPTGLFSHFKILLGFDLSARFQQHFTTKGRLVVEYAQRSGNQKAKTIAATLEARSKVLKNDLPLTYGSFLLLCHLLKEDQDLVIMHEDVVDRREMQEKGHVHPHIACAGDDVFNGDCCFVVIDKHALESCDFGTAVAALFATYYVFNVSYPGTSVNTLEFVQRALADINPARGTKSSKSKKSAVPPAVLRLLAELLTID